VVDDINTDCIIFVHGDRQLDFGAHGIGAGHEDGLLIALELVHTAEKADVAQYFSAVGGTDNPADELIGDILGVDIDTGPGIGVFHGVTSRSGATLYPRLPEIRASCKWGEIKE